MVAVRLPEAGLVGGGQPQAAHPLGALPEVQVRDEQPGGAAVLGVERLAVVGVRDPGLAAGEVLEREVGRVAAVAERDRVLGLGLDALEQRVDRDALPGRVQLRPARDAVDVDGDRLARQRAQLVPGPAVQLVDLADDREVPVGERACAGSGRRRGRGSRASRTGRAGRGRPARRGACPESAGDRHRGTDSRPRRRYKRERIDAVKETFFADDAPKPGGPYSHAVRGGRHDLPRGPGAVRSRDRRAARRLRGAGSPGVPQPRGRRPRRRLVARRRRARRRLPARHGRLRRDERGLRASSCRSRTRCGRRSSPTCRGSRSRSTPCSTSAADA